MDMEVLVWIQGLRSTAGDAVMTLISHSADASLVWILLSIIFLSDKRTRRTGLQVLVTVMLCYTLNDLVLKEIFARPRPFFENTEYLPLADASGYSFPSGHTFTSFAAAAMIFLHNRKAGAAALAYAALVAFSRLYVYVHYPSDVIAGALLGIICAVLVFVTAERIYPVGGKASDGA